MPRKLSQVPATNLGTVAIRGYDADGKPILEAHGLRAYDALAYDKISNSPCKAGRNDSLLQDRYDTDSHAKVTVCHPYNEAAVRHVLAGGVHPEYNYREYLEANSHDNVLLPTAFNDYCFKCGLTAHCECHKFDSHGRRIA